MTDSSNSVEATEVLVVGAGPVGLSTAIPLAEAGADVVLIDLADGPIQQSRAVWVHPRTLEQWATLGVAARAIADGITIERIDLRPYGKQIGKVLYEGSGRTAYPFGLMLEQHRTQRLLLDRLAELGLRPRWNTRLTDLVTDADGGVTAQVRREDDAHDHTIRARYVVGADGASSTVRDRIDLALEGGTYKSSFVSADLVMDIDLPHDRAHMMLSHRQTHAFLPLPAAEGQDGRWRVVANFTPALERRYGTDAGPTGVSGLEPDDMRRILAGLHVRHELRAVEAAAVYRSHHRLVDAYRVGDVFLAGDASHIHSPAGGLGMNTGIGDATNLGWKLAAVVNGQASDGLLDTYQAERRPVAESVLAISDSTFTLQASTNPFLSALRIVVLPLVTVLANLTDRGRRAAFDALSQIGQTYRNAWTTTGATDTPLAAGDRLPHAVAGGGSTHDRIRPAGLVALVLGDQEPGAASAGPIGAVLDDLAVPTTTLALGGLGRVAADVGADPALLVVRPDGHLLHAGSAGDLDGLRRSLTSFVAESDKPAQRLRRDPELARGG